MILRAARADEVDGLTALAFRSKAFWGYDDTFMAACRDELRVDPADAVAFYEGQGAVLVGARPSGSVSGRTLPLLARDLAELPAGFSRSQANRYGSPR